MEQLNHESECKGIPFNFAVEPINILPYGSALRIMYQALFITGCRIRELDNFKKTNLYGEWFYWELGKAGHKWRKERLPESFLDELKHYRDHYRIYNNKLFGIKAETFVREFNRDVRPLLSKGWSEKRFKPCKSNFTTEYIYQMKGLRKNFMTLEFARQLDKWKDPSIAIEMTSKRAKHSSKNITVYHYIESFDSLNVNRFKEYTPAQIMGLKNQTRILDYNNKLVIE